MAKSYAGYVKRPTPINWGDVAGGIVKKLGDIEQEHAAFREKYDTMAADTIKEIGKYEAGKSKAFNDLVYDATAEGRTMIHEMHNKLKRGEISPDEFNRMTMSISNQWEDFNNLSKNYNTAVASVIEGLEEGVLSEASQWALEQFGEVSNLKGKRLQWMPSEDGYTNLYVTSVDSKGNIIENQTKSVTSLTNPGNLLFQKVDLPLATQKFTSTLATFQRGRTTDPRLNRDAYNNVKNNAIVQLTATHNKTMSILVDYGDKDGNKYTLYKEGDEVPEYGIKMVLDENQNWTPEINDTLTTKARESVDAVFESQVGSRITPSPIDRTKDDGVKEEKEWIESFMFDMEIAQEALTGNEGSIEEIMLSYNKTKPKDPIKNIAAIGDKTTIEFESGEKREFSNLEDDRVESAKDMMIYLRPESNPSEIRSTIKKIEAMGNGLTTVEGEVTEGALLPKSTAITLDEWNKASTHLSSLNQKALVSVLSSFGSGYKIKKIPQFGFRITIGEGDDKEVIYLLKKDLKDNDVSVRYNLERIKQLLVERQEKTTKKTLPGKNG